MAVAETRTDSDMVPEADWLNDLVTSSEGLQVAEQVKEWTEVEVREGGDGEGVWVSVLV